MPAPRQGLSRSSNVTSLLSKVGGVERGASATRLGSVEEVGGSGNAVTASLITPRRGERGLQSEKTRQEKLQQQHKVISIDDSPDPLTARKDVDVGGAKSGGAAAASTGGGGGLGAKLGRARKSPTPGRGEVKRWSPSPSLSSLSPVPEMDAPPRRSGRSAASTPLQPKAAGVVKRKGKGAVKGKRKVDEDGFEEVGMTTEDEAGDEIVVGKRLESDAGKSKAKNGAAVKKIPPPTARRAAIKADSDAKLKKSIVPENENSDSELDADIDAIISKRKSAATTKVTRGKKDQKAASKTVPAPAPAPVEKRATRSAPVRDDSDIEATTFIGKAKSITKNAADLGSHKKELDVKKAVGKKDEISGASTSIILDELDLDRDELHDFFSTPVANPALRRANVTYKKKGGHIRSSQQSNGGSSQELKSPAKLEKPRSIPKVEAEIARPKFLDPRTLDGPTGENKKASKKIKIGSSPKKTGTAFYNPLEDRNDLFNSPDHLQVAQLCSQLEKEGSQTSLLNSPSKKRKTEYLSDSDGSALSEVPSCASSLRYDDDEDISLPNIDFDTSFFDNPTQAGPPSCPICHEVYDDDFLALIADDVVQKRSDVQAHLDRCKTHKRHSAEKICRARKYPALDIDWRKLKLRIVKHIPHLCEILEQKRKSEYRDGLWEEANRKTKNKGARKLFESDFQSHTPGYYGPKGAHVMLDTIMQKLANRIRELGTNDRLIAGGGVSGFVQAVLVPELGVRLIMEDMAVNEDKAKIIAKDTVKIGELVNDDEGSMDFDDFDDDDDDDGFGDVVEEEKAGRKRRSRREESGSGKGATTTAGTTGKTGKTGKGKKWVTL